jgi:molecular chaperone GrpE
MEDLNKDLDTNKLEQNSEILTEDSHRDQNAAEASGNEVMEDQPDTSAKQGPEAEIEKWQKESADWKDKYVRLYAEFENFRQRTSKEKLNLISTATEGLMLELLPVIDDFERRCGSGFS